MRDFLDSQRRAAVGGGGGGGPRAGRPGRRLPKPRRLRALRPERGELPSSVRAGPGRAAYLGQAGPVGPQGIGAGRRRGTGPQGAQPQGERGLDRSRGWPDPMWPPGAWSVTQGIRARRARSARRAHPVLPAPTERLVDRRVILASKAPGPTGPQGATGPQGGGALGGEEGVDASGANPATDTLITASVDCPTGKVLGGGGRGHDDVGEQGARGACCPRPERRGQWTAIGGSAGLGGGQR